MSSSEDLFDQEARSLQQLGLRDIPFSESPIGLDSQVLRKIFTGREAELRQVFRLFQGQERRRILIYGHIGIGKSAFLLEVLSVIQRKIPEMLVSYTSLSSEPDLPTAAVIALAQEMAEQMPNDDVAQQVLYQLGIPTGKPLKQRTSEVGASMAIGAKISETDQPIPELQYPAKVLDILIDRAQKKFPRGVLIGIDDLDKQLPQRIRELMNDAQGMLKGRAWYMITGHPFGIAQDLLTSERGLFDLTLELKELEPDTRYKMLINYLNSTRINNNCTDPNQPEAVLPFLPETARRFCELSGGHPRRFNRLGSAVLLKAAELRVKTITPEVLAAGLDAAVLTLSQQAVLGIQAKRVFSLLQKKGSLSDETITLDDLQSVGLASFNELVPYLERLRDADLVSQNDREEATEYKPVFLPESTAIIDVSPE